MIKVRIEVKEEEGDGINVAEFCRSEGVESLPVLLAYAIRAIEHHVDANMKLVYQLNSELGDVSSMFYEAELDEE